MSFLNPTSLWSLLALAIPIAIHLWSRKKVRVIKIGSTKFLEELDPKQTNSILLNERLLLLLRLLLLGLLGFILAGPQIKSEVRNRSITYLVEPSLLSNKKLISLIDTLPEDAKRLLQKDFPILNDVYLGNSNTAVPNYWQLAREMERLPTDSIVVFTNAFASGLKGALPETSANVRWLSIDSELSGNTVIRATLNKNEIQLLSVKDGYKHLGFEKEIVPRTSDRFAINSTKDSIRLPSKNGNRLPLLSDPDINVLIVYADSLSKEMKFMQFAYKTAARYLNKQIEVVVAKENDSLGVENVQNLIWLSHRPSPEVDSKVVLFRPDSLSTQLIEPGNKINNFYLTEFLNSENSFNRKLVEQVISLLDLNVGLKNKINDHDKRMLAIDELQTATTGLPQEKMFATVLELTPWLWALFIVLIGVERVVAKYRRQ